MKKHSDLIIVISSILLGILITAATYMIKSESVSNSSIPDTQGFIASRGYPVPYWTFSVSYAWNPSGSEGYNSIAIFIDFFIWFAVSFAIIYLLKRLFKRVRTNNLQ